MGNVKLSKIEHGFYEENYKDLPFEDVLREYRKKNILKLIKRYPHKRFLEIGCGPDPLFNEVTDYSKMVVIEPGDLFFRKACTQANGNPKIIIINDFVENCLDFLEKEVFDFIIIGGFLHEINNPDHVLQVIRNFRTSKTIVYTFVPNARSFHRLLANEMGITDSIYQKSGHDMLFQRQNVFDINSFNALFEKNGFEVLDSGSYFIKPFTHDQMSVLLNNGIINKKVLDGLEKMTKFMPDMGAELWNICKKK